MAPLRAGARHRHSGPPYGEKTQLVIPIPSFTRIDIALQFFATAWELAGVGDLRDELLAIAGQPGVDATQYR